MCCCLWFMLPPQAVLMLRVPVDTCGMCCPLASAASRSQVDAHDRCYHKRPYWCLWSMLLLGPCWYEWPVLPPRVVLVFLVLLWTRAVWMSIARVTTEGHVDVHILCYVPWNHDGVRGLCCYWRPFWGPCFELRLKTLLMSVVCAATWSHVGVCGSCCLRSPYWCQNIRGQCCSLCCSWSMLWLRALLMFVAVLPPETILMPVVHVDPGGHVGVRGPCYHQKPCGSLWSALPLTVEGKELLLQWYQCLQTHSWEKET